MFDRPLNVRAPSSCCQGQGRGRRLDKAQPRKACCKTQTTAKQTLTQVKNRALRYCSRLPNNNGKPAKSSQNNVKTPYQGLELGPLPPAAALQPAAPLPCRRRQLPLRRRSAGRAGWTAAGAAGSAMGGAGGGGYQLQYGRTGQRPSWREMQRARCSLHESRGSAGQPNVQSSCHEQVL